MKISKCLAPLLLALIALCAVEALHGLRNSGSLSLSAINKILRKSKREDDVSDKELLLSFNNYLARQLTLQQLFIEERLRSEGGSGIKQGRLSITGSKPYFQTSFTGTRIAANHEHSNNDRVVGMGEQVAVLNGLEFRTRHNDYKMVKPSTTSSKYHETENIIYPAVPPSVKEKATVEEQIAEMREYFRAWKEEDTSIRDYTDYFKPALCYLEGAWTTSAENEIEDPFDSDRHKLAANSWFDLQEKIRFTSYTGKKDVLENFAYLPTTTFGQANATLELAQWNYRILCHPLKKHIDPSRLCLIDDLQSRMGTDRTLEEHRQGRSARFRLSAKDDGNCKHMRKKYDLTDELMEEVPGVNNYGGYLEDDSLGATAQHFVTGETLNAAYYHRWIKINKKDAMGDDTYHRAYADPAIFMALTNNTKIAAMTVNACNSKGENCVKTTQRVTYAIPLEIIFMTPLYNWNPYKIQYKGWHSSDQGKTVAAKPRDGTNSTARAFDGTNNKKYYQTPSIFYDSSDISEDVADTAQGKVFVLGEDGLPHEVVASGTRIILPSIPGVGVQRTRYAIMPVHHEQSAMWKELAALKDVALNPKSQKDMYYEQFPEGIPKWVEPPQMEANVSVTYQLKAGDDAHMHEFTLTPQQYLSLGSNQQAEVSVTTSEEGGHSHSLTLVPNLWGSFKYSQCDGSGRKCGGHDRKVLLKPLNE